MTIDLSSLSMLELFRMEAESQMQLLTQGLLSLERGADAAVLESCMRAAHSLKGAARIVDLTVAVSITHAMEDCFVAAQQGRLTLRKPQIDLLLSGVDLLGKVASASEAEVAAWGEHSPPEVESFLAALSRSLSRPDDASTAALVSASEPPRASPPLAVPGAPARHALPAAVSVEGAPQEAIDRVLRVTAQSFDRVLGMAGESLVHSRRLAPFGGALLRVRRTQQEASRSLDRLREVLGEQASDPAVDQALSTLRRHVAEGQRLLAERVSDFESIDRRSSALAQRLYEEALRCRMRPLADGLHGLPRMVRDLARSLGKEARLEIGGARTELDREVLDRLEAPLGHLLRNAVDHGIDAPAGRRAAGKPSEGVVRIDARHAAGMLQIGVSDDGQGVDTERVRAAIVARGLSDPSTAAKLSGAELYAFLFLPGFTLRDAVTDISGRGVGLDVVHSVVKQLGGTVQITSERGRGSRFQLQLPVSVSVVRSLVAEVGGDPYALPLAHVERVLSLERGQVQLLEGRQHVVYGGHTIGLVSARQVLGGGEAALGGELLSVIVLAEHDGAYGLVVDRLLGVRELVIQVLDRRLGKIKDIAAGALLEDGTPVLIVDGEDLVRSIQKLVAQGGLSRVEVQTTSERRARKKRVLVVDDSLTVRELERKLIESGGYQVEVAVDGVDGWNAVRTGEHDLVVTDIDMPRMDGIELVRLIRRDPRLGKLPVMIVSYKDREEDRQRGLEAGADFYLAKGSFHGERLLEAVVDLIGEP